MISGVCRNGAARDAGVVSAVLRVLSLRSCATSSCGALQLFFTAKNEPRSPRACTYAAAKARFGVAVLCMRYGIPVPVDRIVPVAEIRGPSNELDERIITRVNDDDETLHNNQIVRSPPPFAKPRPSSRSISPISAAPSSRTARSPPNVKCPP